MLIMSIRTRRYTFRHWRFSRYCLPLPRLYDLGDAATYFANTDVEAVIAMPRD